MFLKVYELRQTGSINLPEYELNRCFISDPLHICNRAAVTTVPLVDEVLSGNIRLVTTFIMYLTLKGVSVFFILIHSSEETLTSAASHLKHLTSNTSAI